MDAMGMFLLWCLFAGGVGMLANSRGRSGFGFFLLSVVLSPLLGLIVVLLMSDLAQEKAVAESQAQKQAFEHERQLESIKAVTASVKAPAPNVAGSVADEIAKLLELKDRGALTAEEFQAQKAKLLQAT